MRLIFFDIDGVLVTDRKLSDRLAKGIAGRPVVDPDCVQSLNMIIRATQAQLVLASAWRFSGLLEMQAILKLWGVEGELVGFTPDLTVKEHGQYRSVPRGREIRQYLNQMEDGPVDAFVILDDDPGMENLMSRLVLTEFARGLTFQDAQLAIQMMRAQISQAHQPTIAA